MKDEFSTYKSVHEYLNFTDTIEAQRRPSIIKAFENVLFASYSDAVAKYNKMLAVFPKFTPAFKELFADRKSTRLNSSHDRQSRMPSSA